MKTRLGNGVSINNPFCALKHRNFRYYWIGMSISTTGSWMQNIAQPWLAYKLTDSAFLLGLVSALQFLPVLLFSLFAGVLVDRFPKKKILVITQTGFLLTTLFLAILVQTKQIQYWHLLVTSTIMGFMNTLDMPSRQSFIIELVGSEDLMNGIALNSAVFNIARIIGPAIAGLVMSWSIAVCFFANSISFAAVLISLFFIKPNPIKKAPLKDERILFNIKEGLQYIYRKKQLFSTIIMMAIVSIFAMNFSVLVPVFSDKVLNRQESGFGFLMSLMGLGSLAGALLIATLSRSGPKRFILRIVPMIVGALLILLGLTSAYWLTALVLAATGFFFIMFSSTTNSNLQLNASNEFRGRVMSLYSLVFAGSTPIGNLFSGAVAQNFGPRLGFILGGALIIALVIPLNLFLNRKERGRDEAAEDAEPVSNLPE